MSLIRDHSDECSTSPLEWFNVLPTQTAIEKSSDVEYQSLTALREGVAVEFYVPAALGEYTDLHNTKLYLKCKIVRPNGTNLNADNIVAPVNDLFNSLWSNVELFLNDRLISHSNNTHGYMSVISHLIHDSDESLHSERAMRLIYKDTPNQMNVTEARLANSTQSIPGYDLRVAGDTFEVIPADAIVGNNGLYQRYVQTRASKPVEMLGRLRIDMCEQERYLPNGVSMKLRFHRQRDAFMLMSGENFKIELLDATLLVRRVRPSPGVLAGHADAILKMPAKFPVTRKEVKTISLARGLRGVKQDSLFLGQLPKRVVVCMVDGSAFAGAFAENPYNFKHYSMNHIQLFRDGEPVRSRTLRPNLAAGNYLNCYETLYSGLNNMDGEKATIIKRCDWDKGYSLCAFDLTPDMDADDHYSLISHGNLRLDVEFAAPLPNTVDIIVYAEFDNVLEITADRNIQMDYV